MLLRLGHKVFCVSEFSQCVRDANTRGITERGTLDGERPLGKWKSHSDYDCSHRSRGFVSCSFRLNLIWIDGLWSLCEFLESFYPTEKASATPLASVISRTCENRSETLLFHSDIIAPSEVFLFCYEVLGVDISVFIKAVEISETGLEYNASFIDREDCETNPQYRFFAEV